MKFLTGTYFTSEPATAEAAIVMSTLKAKSITINNNPFLPGYPNDYVLSTFDSSLMGYYMEDDGYNDIIVLSILS